MEPMNSFNQKFLTWKHEPKWSYKGSYVTISSLRSKKNEKRADGATANLHCRYDWGQCSLWGT
jgi:hypothetical protein